ncbi:MAG: phosphoribosylamine---glycine ligase [Gaiellaceae bacterium]|nr:phosphoribosylamine---glycine ligase [Gaiellaceae bacterium]MDX6479067.1 phosphoribosylamine---glycine ligase [Gaiellaceae bacterium]
MKVLLVGSGGREHALAWKLAQSPDLSELHAAPGNPGIAGLGRCHPVRAEDGEGLLGLAGELDAGLVVIGPEAPLVAGVADELRHAGFVVFGPGAGAARIEGSKLFAKEVMRAAGVSTAEVLDEPRVPCVIKADGLTAGKGVFICRTEDELQEALQAAATHGAEIVAEELLEGEELSLFALASGTDALPLPAARDYSRVGDGDTGPNTGGMGSFSPVPGIGEDEASELVDAIHRPVLEELSRRGTPFVGVLYAGLMLTDDGPRVLEFNARFGDPETQVILPRLAGDLLPALIAAGSGELGGVELDAGEEAAVTIALAAPDYPLQGDSGTPIDGIADAEASGALVFHAGTALRDGRVATNGGRILNVTALGSDLAEARERAYAAVDKISFAGMRYRTDIAALAAVDG